MTRRQRLTLNPRLLFWARVLTEVKALNAVVVLFYLHRGVSIEQVFYLTLIWSVANLIAEVPSGYLADRIGRQKTMILGVILLIISNIGNWLAHGFPAFVVVFFFVAWSWSMFSGTDEAFLYDTLKELGKEKQMTKFQGKLLSATNAAKIFIPALGALIAHNLLESEFRILIIIDLVACVAALVLLAWLTEPKHIKSVEEYEVGIFRQSLQIIKGEPFLLRAALNRTLPVIATIIVWRIYQPWFAELGLAAVALAFVYFAMNGLNFLSKWYIEPLEKVLGAINIVRGSLFLSIFCMLAMYLFDSKAVALIGVILSIVFINARMPLFSKVINRRIESHSRATTLSSLNVLKSVLDLPILIITGFVTAGNLTDGFLISIALCVIAIVAFPIREHELA